VLSLKTDRLAALYRVAVVAGLQRGELVGLRWSDIDLDTQFLRVVQQVVQLGANLHLGNPRTRAGTRLVPLDGVSSRRNVERGGRRGRTLDTSSRARTGASCDRTTSPRSSAATSSALTRPSSQVPRAAPHEREPGPGRRRPHEGRQRPAGALDDHDHRRPVQPRPARGRTERGGRNRCF